MFTPTLASMLRLPRVPGDTLKSDERLMYLACQNIAGERHYFIRQSYPDGQVFRSRELFSLGTDPTRFICYAGGNAYWYDEAVLDALDDRGVKVDAFDLDPIFWPFLDAHIRAKVDHFHRRATSVQKKPNGREKVHLFDKRRLHYLRCARMDQGRIGQLPAKYWKPLFEKSRDELEQFFWSEEKILKPHEHKTYTFVIFDLQRLFTQSFAKTHPQGLDQDEVDQGFERSLCRLAQDSDFWSGFEQESDRLPGYLIRYALMFFDSDYAPPPFSSDPLRAFINAHRRYQPPRWPTMDMDQAAQLFGISAAELKGLTRQQLSRLYRRRAHLWHPDKGGDAEKFTKLTEAYQQLKQTLKREG